MLVHTEGGRKEAIGGGNELAKKIGLLGKTRRDRIRNEVIGRSCVRWRRWWKNTKRRLSCFGHVARMENRRLAGQCTLWSRGGNIRSRGRQIKT